METSHTIIVLGLSWLTHSITITAWVYHVPHAIKLPSCYISTLLPELNPQNTINEYDDLKSCTISLSNPKDHLYSLSKRKAMNQYVTLSSPLRQGTFTNCYLLLPIVTNWPTSSSQQDLQRFLGFGNFYRCFIWGYTFIASPLTVLTSLKIQFFCN